MVVVVFGFNLVNPCYLMLEMNKLLTMHARCLITCLNEIEYENMWVTRCLINCPNEIEYLW